jgi:hypothetical protein
MMIAAQFLESTLLLLLLLPFQMPIQFRSSLPEPRPSARQLGLLFLPLLSKLLRLSAL